MRYTKRAALLGGLASIATPAFGKGAAVDLSTVKLETLALSLDKTDSEFMVIDARMDETGTAAVFFGLVGAAVNSASNNSEDDAKAEPYRTTAAGIDVEKLVTDAFYTRLASKSISLAGDPSAAPYRLLIAVGEWGLARKAQKPDMDMRVFLKINLSITDAKGRVVWGPQREHSIGQVATPLRYITPEMFKSEMEALAQKAGQQIANKLIYR